MVVQFVPFVSLVEPAFWHAYARLKLDELRLDDSQIPISATYSPPLAVCEDEADGAAGCTLRVGADGLHAKSGRLVQFNTLQAFKSADKASLFYDTANRIYRAVRDSGGDTASLNEFLLLVYGDIKTHRYYYWFAFPALLSDPPWKLEGEWESATCLDKQLLSKVTTQLAAQAHGAAFWINKGTLVPLCDRGDILLFVDPSPLLAPGWPLRNILAYCAVHLKMRRVRVLCWKDVPGAEPHRSVIGTLALDAAEDALCFTPRPDTALPDAVGWERNSHGRLAPKTASLGDLLDPKVLAERAVSLNLQLMRWRMVPDLPLEQIQAARVLIIGAGTLGSYAARTLLGWGIRHISFVDNGRVSYTNPVRQPLYEFSDCLSGGRLKVEAACDTLQRVFPSVSAEGYDLEVPMPGHPVSDADMERMLDSVETLERLYDSHDAVILGTDSRESRWLPTLLGIAKGVPVVNAALGFDTFVVMRHGVGDAPRLGCYFCSDVVAPTNSLVDRTLDQMCTVSRPGLAAIAAATAVELLVTLLQHPQRANAPTGEDGAPHQIRGSLGAFSTVSAECSSFWGCTACSPSIVQAYKKRGGDFVIEVCKDAGVLEHISGLDTLKRETDALSLDIDWTDSE
ncbi:dCMP deaminase [Malassezia cuniculi]|uniref:Ubiquitin-like modifier-activating enzyme ATG7 n=1 Tax=Malassezia cuniculi TaxID=948313 RepID=A0AAF0ETQ3_9BASI|nr:dCMP deaminase [Malassezia cuniculi]